MIIDYEDMVNANLIKEASVKPREDKDKYAIFLKMADGRSVGKFRVTTKEDVENSIYALDNNQELTPAVKESASYWVKQAAEYFNIENDIVANESPREIDISLSIPQKEDDTSYVLKMGGLRYLLENEPQIKMAEEDFLTTQYKYPMKERQKIALTIIKQASKTDHIPSEVLGRYVFPHLSDNIEKEIEYRKSHIDNEEYSKIAEKLMMNKEGMNTLEFIDNLRSLDKAFGFDAEKLKSPYEDLLQRG